MFLDTIFNIYRCLFDADVSLTPHIILNKTTSKRKVAAIFVFLFRLHLSTYICQTCVSKCIHDTLLAVCENCCWKWDCCRRSQLYDCRALMSLIRVHRVEYRVAGLEIYRASWQTSNIKLTRSSQVKIKRFDFCLPFCPPSYEKLIYQKT